jgi:hypothetical protein
LQQFPENHGNVDRPTSLAADWDNHNSADETSPNTDVEAALMSIAFVLDDLLFIDVRPASGGLDATPRQEYFEDPRLVHSRRRVRSSTVIFPEL